jgi:hypothetical protein
VNGDAPIQQIHLESLPAAAAPADDPEAEMAARMVRAIAAFTPRELADFMSRKDFIVWLIEHGRLSEEMPDAA